MKSQIVLSFLDALKFVRIRFLWRFQAFSISPTNNNTKQDEIFKPFGYIAHSSLPHEDVTRYTVPIN